MLYERVGMSQWDLAQTIGGEDCGHGRAGIRRCEIVYLLSEKSISAWNGCLMGWEITRGANAWNMNKKELEAVRTSM
jgi:hypothetical protein